MPTLPLQLLKQLGAAPDLKPKARPKPSLASRKELRKADRRQKKAQRNHANSSVTNKKAARYATVPPRKYLMSIRKKERAELDDNAEEESDVADEDGFRDGFDIKDEEEDGGEEADFSDEESEKENQEQLSPSKQSLSKVMRERLAQDDAEIAELERKLGLRGRKNLPQSFKDDGLFDLLDGLDDRSDEDKRELKKRKAEADEWLASKRRRAAEQDNTKKQRDYGSEEGDEDSEDFGEALEDSDEVGSADLGMDGDGLSGEDDDFEGFGSDEEPESEEQRVRENPYVAPKTGDRALKYVPPSLRKESGSDAELIQRLRRQTQGLVNRVTESNLLTITSETEKLYRDNPRQHVSSALVDVLLVQVCDPTALPDTLLILTAGFATALHKVIGMDFGAQLIQEVVERFGKCYDEAKAAAVERSDVPKQTSNLITFLSELYNFQLVGPSLLFDYIRLLLDDLSELNAELLLRIIRMSGPALRQDDPMALKDIVALIRPAVAKRGENNLSVRTKFMIDTIHDLKNNKMKAGAGASLIISEHSARMKKTLGSLNSRKLKSTEPLRIGLKDIQESDKKGKWWLVGASLAGPSAGEKNGRAQKIKGQDGEDEDLLASSDSEQGPNFAELARQQMMNTDVRRSIFVAIVSACDYEDAYARVSKLRLNKERQREIANVIIQCCGAEQRYNPYYTLVAKRLCSDHKVRWSFQHSLWKLFRRLGESIFGEDADDVDEDEEIDLRRVFNNAKMFGTLVAEGTLGLGVLKCLNLPYLQLKTKVFVEVMLITIFQECQTKDGPEGAISAVFKGTRGAPELARGLQWFLKKAVRKTALVENKAEMRRLKDACKAAEGAVEGVLAEDQDPGD